MRHFDRGRRLLIGLALALVIAACSDELAGGGQTGTAGTAATGQGGGGAGGVVLTGGGGDGTGGVVSTGGGGGGTGGVASTGEGGGGTGGVAGTFFGRGGGGGTGGVAGTSFGGVGGGGTGGTGGMMAICPTGAPTFSICVVSSADVLPLPDGSSGAGGGHQDSITAAGATIEAVGTGTAPARCHDARVFGAAAGSERWLQVRTADNVLWTIGLRGFGDAPLVQAGDPVTLDLNYRRYLSVINPAGRFPRSDGYVQLSNAAGTPLLWAGSNSYSATWLSLAMGQPLCDRATASCPYTRYDVIATINGGVAPVAPFSAVNLGGYTLAVGEYAVRGGGGPGGMSGGHTQCAFEGPPPFMAAAVKAP